MARTPVVRRQAARRPTLTELERERARYDKLLEKYHRLVEKLADLRRTGFDPAVERKVHALPEVEKLAQRRAEAAGLPEAQRAFIENAVKDLMRGGAASEAAARKEAERMAAEVYGFEVQGA